MSIKSTELKFLIEYANKKIYEMTSSHINDNVWNIIDNKFKDEYFSESQKLLADISTIKTTENYEKRIEKYFIQLKKELDEFRPLLNNNVSEKVMKAYRDKTKLYDGSISKYLRGQFDDVTNQDIPIGDLSINGFSDKSIFKQQILNIIKRIINESKKEKNNKNKNNRNKITKFNDPLFDPTLDKVIKFYTKINIIGNNIKKNRKKL